jgi:hypothetical protein
MSGRGSQNQVERVKEFFKKLPKGSISKALIDESLNIECICLQTPLMQKLFQAYPETLLMDTTYLVNSEGCEFFTLMGTDACGRGWPVLFALLSSENQIIIGRVFDAFQQANNVSATSSV